jgi:hypothetical protein
LFVQLQGLSHTSLKLGKPRSGQWTFANARPVSFVNVETFNQGGLAFLVQAFLDLLGRAGNPKTVAHLGVLLDQGASRTQIALAIISSPPYVFKEVNDAYVRLLGRPAEPRGLNAGVRFLQQGGTLEQLKAILLGSQEYFVHHGGGTINGFLNAVFPAVLQRPLDPQNARILGGLLARGHLSRRDVALLLLTSPEARRLQVRGYYKTFLRRPADQMALSKGVNALLHGLRDEVFIASLIGSNEYLARLGS